MNKNNFDAPKGGEPSAEFPGVVRTAEDWKKLEERFNLETDRPGDVEAEAEEEMTPEQLEAEWLADKTEYYSYQNKQKLQESLHYLYHPQLTSSHNIPT